MANRTTPPAASELTPRTQAEVRRAQARLAFLLLCGLLLAACASFYLLLRRHLLLDGLVLLSLAALTLGRVLTDSRLPALWEGDLFRRRSSGTAGPPSGTVASRQATETDTVGVVGTRAAAGGAFWTGDSVLQDRSAEPPPESVVVDVVYQDGVLKPVGNLNLPPGTLVNFRLVAYPKFPPEPGSGAAAELPNAHTRATPPSDESLHPAVIRLEFVAIGMLVVLLGQVVLHEMPQLGLLLFGLGLAAFFVGVRPSMLRAATETFNSPMSLRPRVPQLVGGVLLGMLTWVESGGNRFTVLGVTAWTGSLVLWLWAWWPSGALPIQRLPSPPHWRFVTTVLGLILLAGAAFRFYDLPRLPAEMISDHAEKLLDVRDVLAGQRPIFFPRNTGREPAQFYLSAFIAGPLGFGLSHLTLKLGTATAGWLTIPMLFVAARRGLGAPMSVALLAAALLAISKWHVEINRQALRPSFTPLPVVVLLIFLFRAVCYNDRRDWLLAGLTLGLGLYGYTPFRVVPLIVIAAVVILWVLGPGAVAKRRDVLTNAGLAVATAFLAFIPLGRYGLQNPEQFWERSYTRVAEGATVDLWSNFWLNVWNAVLMFHWRGDIAWVNALPGDPLLDLLTGTLFLLGLGFLVLRFLRQRRAVDLLLLVSLPLLLLPSILALGWPDENPSTTRAGGAVPVVMLIAAWPLGLLCDSLAARGRSAAAISVAVGVLGVAAVLNWQAYFVDFRASYDRSAWNTTEIGAVVREWAPRVGGPQHVYVKAYPHWVDTRNVAFNAGVPEWNSVFPPSELRPQDLVRPDPEPRLLIVYPQDRRAVEEVERAWAGGDRYLVQSRVPSKEFWVFVKPGFSR